MRIVVLVLGLLLSGCVRPPDDVAASPCEARFANGEFASNFAMIVALSRPPALGETATLTAAVCAKEPTRAVVSVRLSDRLEWRQPPEGTVVTTQQRYGTCESIAAREWELRAMTPVHLAGTVAVTRPGPAELAGSVASADGAVPGNSASVFITAGLDHESSYFGYPDPPDVASATAVRPAPTCD